jgi:hypothetical protein
MRSSFASTPTDLFRVKYPQANALTEQQIVDASIIDEGERSDFISRFTRGQDAG